MHRVCDGIDNHVVHQRLASSAPTLNETDRQERISVTCQLHLIRRKWDHPCALEGHRPAVVGREGQFRRHKQSVRDFVQSCTLWLIVSVCHSIRHIGSGKCWKFEKDTGDMCTSKSRVWLCGTVKHLRAYKIVRLALMLVVDRKLGTRDNATTRIARIRCQQLKKRYTNGHAALAAA